MGIWKKSWILPIGAFLTHAWADSLTLKNGRIVEGNRIERFRVDQISGIQFQTGRAVQGSRFDRAAPPQPGLGDTNSFTGIEIAAGTAFTVRLIDSFGCGAAWREFPRRHRRAGGREWKHGNSARRRCGCKADG